MRLYHHPMSSNARRAVMTALALGTEVELVLVDLAKGEQRRPEYLRMNPNGKVPVLDDDGFVLWESHAIMKYLAEATPGQTLYPGPTEPGGRHARADVDRWMFWSAYHLQPSVSVLGWENVVKPMLGRGAPEPVLVARGEELVRECVRVLDRHLAGKQWVAHDRLTLADLALSTPFAMAKPARLPMVDCPNLTAWLDRVQSLEVWKKTSG